MGMIEPVIIGDATLYCGDCLDILPTLENVDMTMTSPPYDNLRDYGDTFDGVDLMAVISALYDRTNQGGVVVWNVADATVNGSETGSSFRQALHAMDAGFRLHDTMLYCKPSSAFPESNRYCPAFEYVFIWSVGSPDNVNLLRDKPNKRAGTKMLGSTERQPNGSMIPASRNGKETPAFGPRLNWWLVNKGDNRDKGHPAVMPYDLAAGHIYSWSNPGQMVCDPFMGSGTSGVACVQLGRKFTGIELDKRYFDIACERIERAYAQGQIFEPAPVSAAEKSGAVIVNKQCSIDGGGLTVEIERL